MPRSRAREARERIPPPSLQAPLPAAGDVRSRKRAGQRAGAICPMEDRAKMEMESRGWFGSDQDNIGVRNGDRNSPVYMNRTAALTGPGAPSRRLFGFGAIHAA